MKLDDLIKELRMENKRLQMLSCANCGEKYLSPDGAELYDKNVQQQKENEELKNKIESYNCNANCYKYKEANKYRQALEGIRKIVKTLIVEMPEYHDCYYKDECGDNCTPKKQGKVAYCLTIFMNSYYKAYNQQVMQENTILLVLLHSLLLI